MNKNITKICVVRPLKGRPSWFQVEIDHFQDLISEVPDCTILDFLKRNNVAGRDPYDLELECMEKSHLVIFLPECSSDVVSSLSSFRIEKLNAPALFLASSGAEVSERFLSMVRRHPDVCLFQRYDDVHSLRREGVVLVKKALDHFKVQIETRKRLERKISESAQALKPESD